MSPRSDLRELARPFPDSFVRKNPTGYGTYVPHHVVVQRLLQITGGYDFEMVQIVRGGVAGTGKHEALQDAVVGVIARLTVTVDGEKRTIEDAGDCEQPHNWPHDGARLKDAMSDAIKRCAARLGLGLHLWAQDDYFLDRQLDKADEQ